MSRCWTAYKIKLERDLGNGLAFFTVELDIDLSVVAVGDVVKFSGLLDEGRQYVIKQMDLERDPPHFDLDHHRLARSPMLRVRYV